MQTRSINRTYKRVIYTLAPSFIMVEMPTLGTESAILTNRKLFPVDT